MPPAGGHRGQVEAFYALDLEVLCGRVCTVQWLCRMAGGRPGDGGEARGRLSEDV